MSFDSVERSVQDSGPAELYDFVAPTTIWRVTSYGKDLVYNGNTYSAVPTSRSNVMTVDLATDQTDVTIQIPANHPVAQAFVNGIPMRDLLVTITRAHLPAFVVSQWWQGYASSISFSGRTAGIRVPSGTFDALSTIVPAVQASRLCNNVLFDAQCTVIRGAFTFAFGVSNVSSDGKTIFLNGNLPATPNTQAPYSRHGEIVHVASQERRTIIDQPTLSSVLLQAPFPNGVVKLGDSLLVSAGCDKLISTCDSKFANAVNHGGHAYMPPSNLFYVGLVNARY